MDKASLLATRKNILGDQTNKMPTKCLQNKVKNAYQIEITWSKRLNIRYLKQFVNPQRLAEVYA